MNQDRELIVACYSQHRSGASAQHRSSNCGETRTRAYGTCTRTPNSDATDSDQRRAHEELSGKRTTRNKTLLQPKEVFLRYRSWNMLAYLPHRRDMCRPHLFVQRQDSVMVNFIELGRSPKQMAAYCGHIKQAQGKLLEEVIISSRNTTAGLTYSIQPVWLCSHCLRCLPTPDILV